MSEVRTKPAKTDTGPGLIRLLEEGVHLVRRAPAADLCWYYAGAVPWVLGVLYFWAYLTWYYPGRDLMAWAALGLVFLFGWLKFCQARFGRRLLARRMGVSGREMTQDRVGAGILREIRVHTAGFFVMPISVLLSFPAGYVWAYFQTLSVCGKAGGDGADEAWEQARLWPMQSIVALTIFAVLGLVVWLNMLVVFLVGPRLANTFLGLENVFGLSGWSVFNTTFLAASVLCAWLVVDPFVKGYFACRCFHARCRSGGEDLLEQFPESGGVARRIALLLLLVGGLWGGANEGLAKDGNARPVAPRSESASRIGGRETPVVSPAVSPVAPAARPAVAPEDLRRSIEGVLAEGAFDWRLRPARTARLDAEEGAVIRFFKTGIDLIKSVWDSIDRAYQRFKKWADVFFGGGKGEMESDKQGGSAGEGISIVGKVLIYVLGACLLLLLGYICWVVVRQAKRNSARRVFAAPAGAPEALPDLEDERVHAAQLSSDGWLALAREKLGAGEWRLAFRALYLAQLATHAEAGQLSLARHKTNLDYELELARRQPGRSELLDTFRRRRRGFDAVWYGRSQPAEAELRSWLSELGQGRAPAP